MHLERMKGQHRICRLRDDRQRPRPLFADPGSTTAMPTLLVRRPRSAIRQFLRSEAASGLVLLLAALAALIAANSGAAPGYAALLAHVTRPVLTARLGPMTVQLWINDGLMALFFLLAGSR